MSCPQHCGLSSLEPSQSVGCVRAGVARDIAITRMLSLSSRKELVDRTTLQSGPANLEKVALDHNPTNDNESRGTL